jgi:hypothetical protein
MGRYHDFKFNGGEINMTTSPECLWCGRPFPARRGGSPKRFCSTAHRMMFWSALRRWGEQAVASGVLTIADIRNGASAACTLLPRRISPSPVPQTPTAADATVTLTETPDFKAAVAEATAAALADAMPRIIATALIAGRP